MRPLVIDELLEDLYWNHITGYQVIDTYDEFSIKRINPFQKKRKLPYVRF